LSAVRRKRSTEMETNERRRISRRPPFATSRIVHSTFGFLSFSLHRSDREGKGQPAPRGIKGKPA
jgi:hypothetical protein